MECVNKKIGCDGRITTRGTLLCNRCVEKYKIENEYKKAESVTDLINKINALEFALNELRAEHARLGEENGESLLKDATSSAEFAFVNSQLENKTSLIAEMEKTIQVYERESISHKASLEKLTMDNASLLKAVTDFKERECVFLKQIEELKQSDNNKNRKIDSLEQIQQWMQAEKEKLQILAEELREEKIALQEKHERENTQLTMLCKEKDENKQKEILALSHELEQHKRDSLILLQEKEKEIYSLHQREAVLIATHEKEQLILKHELKTTHEQLDVFKEEIEPLKEKNAYLELVVKQLEEEKELSHYEYNGEEEKARENASKKIESYNQNLYFMNKKLEEENKEILKQKIELESSNKLMKSKLTSLELSNVKMANDMQFLKKQYSMAENIDDTSFPEEAENDTASIVSKTEPSTRTPSPPKQVMHVGSSSNITTTHSRLMAPTASSAKKNVREQRGGDSRSPSPIKRFQSAVVSDIKHRQTDAGKKTSLTRGEER